MAQSELHPMTAPVEFVGPFSFVGQMAFRLTEHEADAPTVYAIRKWGKVAIRDEARKAMGVQLLESVILMGILKPSTIET